MNAHKSHCLHTISRGIYRQAHLLGLSLPTGFRRRELLGISGDAKTVKGESFGFLTGILYLSPLSLGGFGNLCPFASPGCSADCLNSAGRGAFNSVQKARNRLRQRHRINMTYLTIATDPALWAHHTDGEPFTGELAERIAFLETLFHYEAENNA